MRLEKTEHFDMPQNPEFNESRHPLASLLHALPGVAFRYRPGQARGVLFISEGVLALTGHPAEDFTEGRVHFRDFIHPDDLPRVRAVTNAALEAEQEFEIEYRTRTRPGGAERWVCS